MHLTTALLLLIIARGEGRPPGAALVCSLPWSPLEEGQPNGNYHATLLRSANVIIRVRATAPVDSEPIDDELAWLNLRYVRFEVLEVIKGRYSGGTLDLPGRLTDRDDYNQDTVPYPAVRPAGRTGACFAFSYRKRAQYLLFLRRVQGSLTPY